METRANLGRPALSWGTTTVEFTFRPLVMWPTKQTANRKRAPFRAGYTDTLRQLDRELLKLSARNVVLQVALREEDIRLDGKPRAGSKFTHPGVILSFDSKFGPLSYPCDTFDAWEDNLRAIALALEHLRAVDRCGVTKRGEQYKGWTALPPPSASQVRGPMTKQEATAFLVKHSGLAVNSIEGARIAYRDAAFKLHPDRGGDAEQFKRLQEAKDVLGL